MAVIALLGLVLGVALVCEFVGANEPQETPGTPAGSSGEAAAADGAGDAAAAPKNLKHGELNWQKRPAKEEETQPAKERSSYERDKDVVKPERPEGDTIR